MSRVLTKRIYEWADLCRRLQRAVRRGPRLRNDWDKRVYELLRRRVTSDAVAKLSKRLWATGTESAVHLHNVRTSRSTGQLEVTLAAVVHPASGGRTQYRIPNGVNGWCANKHLPMNARDRESGNSSRNHWYFGGSGVWRRGMGDYYPDAGPRCCNGSLAETLTALSADDAVPPEAWRQRAIRFAKSIARAVRPFTDVIVRYELIGVAPGTRQTMLISGHSDNGHGTFSVTSRYGLRIRLKSPSRGADLTPDFCALIAGPLAVLDDGPATWFAIEMLAPHGHRSHAVASGGQGSPSWILTLKPSQVVSLAREWAAKNIRIPCA